MIFPEDFSANISLATLRSRPDVRQAEHTLAAAYYTDRAAIAARHTLLEDQLLKITSLITLYRSLGGGID